MADQQLITSSKVWFGGDPEIFLEHEGQIVGSEKAISAKGLTVYSGHWLSPLHAPAGELKIIRDGVQVELNLPPTNCREWLALEIQRAFALLVETLARNPEKRYDISFRQVVDVSPTELASLSKLSRRLGCQPSFNWYSPLITIEERLKDLGYTTDTYPKRSAGGHLHFGLPQDLMSERERLPPIFDILLGNTTVMIDRDPGAAERRQVYGRASEFRLPRHGIEYRTLSNFWLHAKELVSLVTGLGRLAIFVLDTSRTAASKGGWAADQALFDLVKMPDIEKAINTNDHVLAKANFEGVSEFLSRHHVTSQKKEETGLNKGSLKDFNTFITRLDADGLSAWFPQSPIDHWKYCDWMRGWEYFLVARVAPTRAGGA